MRTELLRAGVPLSEATERIAHALGLEPALLPATDDPLRTFVETPAGTFPFQTWFVARGHRDEVDARALRGRARGDGRRRASLEALDGADVILIAPSNPYVSIGPILAVAEIRAALERRTRAVRRDQPADRRPRRERARPTGCSRGSPAARRPRTSPPVTRA